MYCKYDLIKNVLLSFGALLLLTSCGGASGQKTAVPLATMPPIEETPLQDDLVEPTATLEATATIIPTETPSPTLTPVPTAEPEANIPFIELLAHTDKINSVEFSPDNELILSAGANDETVYLWNLEGEIVHTLEGHVGGVSDAAFSPDGTYIVTADQDKIARLWNRDGELIKVLEGHPYQIASISFSPDSNWIVTNSSDPRVWDREGDFIDALDGVHRSVSIRTAFSHDGKYLITSGGDAKAQLWKMDSSGQIEQLSEFEGYNNFIGHILFLPDNQRVMINSDYVHTWLIEESGEVTLLTPSSESPRGRVYDSFILENGQINLLFDDAVTRIIKQQGTGAEIIELGEGLSTISTGEFSSDGLWVLTRSPTQARLWDVENGELFASFVGHARGLSHAIISPNAQHVVTASEDGVLRLWDISEIVSP